MACVGAVPDNGLWRGKACAAPANGLAQRMAAASQEHHGDCPGGLCAHDESLGYVGSL